MNGAAPAPWYSGTEAALAAALPPAQIRRAAPIAPLTTYRVGGPARLLVTIESLADAREVAAATAQFRPPVLVVGNGSNLLVADAGFDGLALRLGEGLAAVVPGPTTTAGGSALLPVVARQTAAAGLTGFEWAVGVPGTIGGAVRMNAGGHGSDMAESLVNVDVVDLHSGTFFEIDAAGLNLRYRSSAIESHQLVLAARLRLRVGDPEKSLAEIAEIVRWRRAHQPGGHNAGSVFTNPPGDSAGRLIDAAGCKGLRVGTAHVSTKHANFIQADEGGSADDIAALMVEVVERVRGHSGVVLHPETRMVGFGSDGKV